MKPPFQEMEDKLYSEFVEMRKKARTVSSTWLRTRGKKIFYEMKREDPNKWDDKEFKASKGWTRRFINRRNIKLRKRKCGKEKQQKSVSPSMKIFLKSYVLHFIRTEGK